MRTRRQRIVKLLGFAALLSALTAGSAKMAWSDSAGEIDLNVKTTLDHFYSQVADGKKIAGDAKGVLVFPKVYKAGFGIGGEYGEGALQINGKTVDYYNTVAGSFGFQIGAQKKSIILLFMQDEVLNKLRQSANWKVGADASVTLVNIGADGSIDTAKFNEPILAFVIGQKGLMYNLTLEGTKFTKLDKSQ